MTGRGMRSLLLVLAAVASLATGMLACRSAPVISNDPTQRFYRNAAADFSAIKGINVHYVSVTTSNNEGLDLTRQVFTDSFKTHLGPRFGPIADGDVAPAGGALLDVTVNVNWGNRAARALAGWGAGRAGIEFKFELKDSSGQLLAKLDYADTMSGGAWGGDARALVFSASDKWARYYNEQILKNASP